MSLRQARRTDVPEHLVPWAVAATLLAAVGVVASVWRPTAPAAVPVATDLDSFEPAVLAVVDAYRGPRYVAAFAGTAVGVAVPVLVATTRVGQRWVQRLAGPRAHAPWRAGLVAGTVAVATSIAVLPIAVWIGVVHDGRWGFRTQGPGAWLADRALVSSGRWLGVAAAAMVLVVVMRRWPRSWPYRVTVLGTATAAVLVLLHPVLFQPLRLTTTPLPPGETRAVVEEVVAASHVPGVPLLVGDASRRTTRVNAFVTGLGPTERVVLYDTLLALPPEQVAAIVAHELAHHEHRDLERGVLLVATALLPSSLLLRRILATGWATSVARARGPTDPRLIAVVLAAVAVLEVVGQPAANLVSRRLEAAADARAVEMTGDPATFVRTARVFTVRDLSAPDPPPAVRFLFATHPSIGERIRQAAALSDDPAALPAVADLRADERAIEHAAIRADPP